MNFAHFHLILNHVPLLTIPVVAIFLAYGILRRSVELQRFSMFVLVVTAALVVPVYLTGEPAEKLVKQLPGISEKLIEAHEDAAEFALVLTLVLGGMALATLLFPKKRFFLEVGPKAVLVTSLVAVASLAYTANLGGKIHHPEAYDFTAGTQP